MSIIRAFGRWRPKDRQFTIIFSYGGRLVWMTLDPVSKQRETLVAGTDLIVSTDNKLTKFK